MSRPISVTTLISGRGSNLTALHERAQGYRIGAVISNNLVAAGLAWAKEQGIPTYTVLRDNFPSLSDFKCAVLQAVRETKPDLVALAGFMVVLQPEFVDEYAGKLINIHPSLLPKFPGLDTHRRALEARESVHGASVHFVAAGIDTGAIIAQGQVPVYPSDTPEVLASRTLELEHRLYPWVVKHIAAGEISLDKGVVEYSELLRSQAADHGFILKTALAEKKEHSYERT
jgi:phosphoribosylglycinamide formyltransferase-1